MGTTNSLNSPERSSAVADTGNDKAVPVQVEPAAAEVDAAADVEGARSEEIDVDIDSEDDRKPAAIENNDGDSEDDAAADSEVDGDDDGDDDGENDDSDDNASSDDNNDKDDDQDDDQDDQDENSSDDDGGNNGRAGASAASPDGRQLSDYELLRQERIKRNKQYLTALGLEGTGASGGVKASGKPIKRKRKRVSPSQKRSSLSRRTKESVNYTEPPASVASLIRTADKKKEEGNKDGPPKPQSERKTKDPVNRLEKFVFLEFKSIKAHKRTVLSQAEKNLGKASKEVKYWKKNAEVFERRQQRKLDRKVEQAKIVKRLEDERRQLGGGTAKDLLRDIDNRMPDILAAAARYDVKLEAASNRRELEVKYLENEMKMKMLDSLDRFPKAVKDAVSVLNTALLSRAPKDPPPPRRSRRGDGDEVVESPTTKNGTKGIGGDRNSSGDTLRELQAGLLVSEEDVDSPAKGQSTKGRKRNARNVGGWVSPNFSTEIDRRWLQREKADVEFDISAYVPQVGDTVLYYPGGHREFLDKYPDLLGKKTRSTTRIPLWERAEMEKSRLESETQGEETEVSGGHPLPKSWWNDEWLTGIENDLGKYPLVCRVERTHAEFPPDPYTKVVKKGQGSEDVRIHWKSPKYTADLRNGQKPRLRLAVTLRPLTPLLPPVWDETGPSSDDVLSLPPVFNVVIFPSDLQSFLIPFAWAYSRSHSLSLDESVSLGSLKSAMKARIASFASIDDKFGSFRLDDKESFIEAILTHFRIKQESQRSVLERDFAATSRTFPLPDAFLVLNTLTSFINCRDEQINGKKSPEVKSVHLLDFIRSTLPLWESVTIMKNVYNRKKSQMSPWTLKAGKSQSKTFAEISHTLDEALRVKIECVIEDYAKDNESAEMFYSQITEEDAPGYGCAVACSVSLEKVLHRLKKSGTKIQRCYYRGIEGILSDINAILDNCLLYNSPESTVVEDALKVVTALKKEISRVAQSHFSEMKEVQSADEKRRRLVMHNGQSADCGSPAFIIDTVSNPYKEPDLYRDWLQTTHANMRTGEVSSQTGWVPQPGDEVVYSRRLHAAFVKGHFRSLASEQCLVSPLAVTSASSAGEQQDADNGNIGTEDWSKGNVLWTRASFPKVPSKKSGEDAVTFSTNSPLLALGILFQHDDQDQQSRHVLYWRPCVFPFELLSDDANSCLCCGVCRRTSFLQPASNLPPDDAEDVEQNGLTRSFAKDESGRIDRCFALLKKRCLRDVSPGYVDPQLTKQNVKQGYLPSLVKVGAKSMVTFEDAFEKHSKPTRGADAVVTRGITTKPLPENSSVGPLVKSGFLPPWITSEFGKADIDLRERYGTILPCPNLSLELIHLRLKNQYYRHKIAVENDIVESYVSVVFMLLSEAASRKKNPISIKRMARSLVTGKGKPNTGKPTDTESIGGVDKLNGKSSNDRRATAANSTLTNHVMEEEAELLTRLYRIRELYAVAIVSLSETTHTERVFRLIARPSVAPLDQVVPLTQAPPQDLARAEARQKVKHILSAIGKEHNTSRTKSGDDSLYPPVKVKIVCDGRAVEYDKYIMNLTRATAVKDGNDIHVRIICDGQPFTVERTIPPMSRAVAGSKGNQENVVCVKANSITFGQDDYEANDPLGTVFFGRPGRMSPCGRCQTYKRSMVSCRVRRGHSNIDFDWPTFFGGLEGIDGLLRALAVDATPDKPDTTLDDGITTSELEISSAGNNGRSDTNGAGADKSGHKEQSLQSHTNSTASLGKSFQLTEFGDSAESVVMSTNTLSEHGSTSMRNEGSQDQFTIGDIDTEKSSNPRELVKKATIALSLAKDVVNKARAYAATPARLSAEFVGSCYPVDPDDGHYIYCIICGLSGNLLCCDGCANVVHSHCISLKSIPDDDWFCEECVRKMPTDGRTPREGAKSAVATGTETACLPFGRVVRFDNSPSDELTLTLRALRSARPETTQKKVAGKPCGGEDDDDSRASGSDGDADVLPLDDDDDMATPRKRGRPRKRPKIDSAVSPTKGTKTPRQKREKAKIKAAMDSRPAVPLRNTYPRSPRRTTNFRSFEDPFDGLSNVTKTFLATMNITTAEKFLSSRTTDIAVKFIDWRIKQNMTELKGIGSIASVSGWKAQARKFAKEMGLQDIAEIEPANKASRLEEARDESRKAERHSSRKGVKMSITDSKPGRGRRRKIPSEMSIKDATPKRGRPRKKHAEEEFEMQSLTAESGRRKRAGHSSGTSKPTVRATRGRPRKHPKEEQVSAEVRSDSPPRRGRPRRSPVEQSPTLGRETVEPVSSRKRSRQRDEPSEGNSTRSQRRSQPPKRLIDSVVYDVETPPGRVRHQRQARSIDFGTVKQEQPQILRNSLQAKRNPVEQSVNATYSVTSETSIPQRRQRRATQRLVDESAWPEIPKEIINSSKQAVAVGDSADSFSIDDEQASETRRSKQQRH